MIHAMNMTTVVQSSRNRSQFHGVPGAASLLRCLLRCHVLVTTGGLRDEAIQHVPHGPAPPGVAQKNSA